MAGIVFPAILLSEAGWLKSGESLRELSDASPSDDLTEWQSLRVFDAGGNCFRARRVFREWPRSRIGLLLCRLTNQSISVRMELEEVEAVKLSELVSQVAAVESLPSDAEWKSQRDLVEYVCS